jgi:hypothetical protein
MTAPQVLTALQRRHEALDAEVRKARSEPAPDFVKLTALKRRKLALKDAIAASSRNAN